MNVLYILIPLALLLVGAAVVAFIWAVNSGQFDDTEGPAVRLLMDDDDGKHEPSDENGTPASERKPRDEDPTDGSE